MNEPYIRTFLASVARETRIKLEHEGSEGEAFVVVLAVVPVGPLDHDHSRPVRAFFQASGSRDCSLTEAREAVAEYLRETAQ